MQKLGEILCARQLLSDNDLPPLLSLASASKSRLGDVIVAQGIMGYQPIYTALAEQNGFSFIDLLREPPDASLLRVGDIQHYLQFSFVPWKFSGETTVIATTELTPALHAFAAAHYGADTRFVITTPFDIRKTLERVFGATLEDQCRFGLWRKAPLQSAFTKRPRRNRHLWALAAVELTAIAIWFPFTLLAILVALCNAAYCATMVFRSFIFLRGALATKTQDWPEKLRRMNDAELPIYTILIPMFREAESLPNMLAAMRAMDYPPSKLDIKLLLEEDDAHTHEAALSLKPSYQFDIITIPRSRLRTKPKACNYALPFARGEFITVYDADDRPDPLQLKKAVYIFRNSPKNIACLQARLNYYNAGDNLLTQFFALEYSMLFDATLPGMERMDIPLPLGGTSNHMATQTLRELGNWDPYNVTEDADLGVRISVAGLCTVMLDSITMEEAPVSPASWLRQRSRWIKGYMQTWLVHMRDARGLYAALGFKAFAGFQLVVGLSSIIFLSAPVLWGICVVWLLANPATAFPHFLVQLSLFTLALNLITHWFMGLYCLLSRRRPLKQNMCAVLLYPAYLLLHSAASYRALWQLIVNPYFWDKTTHGLAKQNNPLTA